MEPTTFDVPPVVKTVTYGGIPAAAFARFTEAIGAWWPLKTHSLCGADNAGSVAFEALVPGGRLIETCKSGETHVWGTVLACVAPETLRFSWHVGRSEDTAQVIDVQFAPAGADATTVTLTHAGWERLGDKAAESRENYDRGWVGVLAAYTAG